MSGAGILVVLRTLGKRIGSLAPSLGPMKFRDRRTILALWAVAIALVAVVAALCAAMVSAPQIFADEFGYLESVVALRTGNWDAFAGTAYSDFLPNQLFFALYAMSARGGDPFAVARILNVGWLCIGGLVLWGAAAKCGVLRAGVAVLLAFGLGPLASYSVYFMPETLFAAAFFGACVLGAWTICSGSRRLAVLCGAVLAALPFIKPHGFLALGLVAGLVVWNAVSRRGSGAKTRAASAWLLLLACAGCWSALRFGLPHAPGRGTWLGAYAAMPELMLHALASPDRYVPLAQLFGVHLAIVGSVVTPALAYGLYAAVRIKPAIELSDAESFARALAAITAVALIGFIALTAVFTVGIADSGRYESIDRLHSRYYSFAIPILVLAFLGSPVSREWNRPRQVGVLLLWGLACACAFVLLPRYHWTIVDAPDLFVGLRSPKVSIALIGAAGLVLAAMWRRSPQRLKHSVVAGYACAAILAGLVARSIQLRWTDDADDRAGRFVSALAQEQDVPVVVVADMSLGDTWPYRVACYVPASVRFAAFDGNRPQIATRMSAGTLLVGRQGDLPTNGVDIIARFGERTVARVTRDTDRP